MNYKIILCNLFFISVVSSNVSAQIGINTDGTNPDPSAMLDVKSTDKGMLVPRMDSIGRNNIIDPAVGLLTYDSTTLSFWYWDEQWNEIINNNSLIENLTSSLETNDSVPNIVPEYELIEYTAGDFRGLGVLDDSKVMVNIGINSNQVEVFDVSDAEVLDTLNSYTFDFIDIFIDDNYAYTVEKNGVVIYNVSDPFNIVSVSEVNFSGGSNITTHADKEGDLIYIALKTEKILVVNVSDVANPTLVNTYQSNKEAEDIKVSNNIVYLLEESDLSSFNFSNPTNPVSLDGIEFDGNLISLETEGDYAYITANSPDRLLVVDISNPNNMSLFSTINLAGFSDFVTVADTHLVVSQVETNKLLYFSNSDTENIQLDFELDIAAGSHRDIDEYNGDIYLSRSNGLTIVDKSITNDYVFLGYDPTSQSIITIPNTFEDDQKINKFALSGNVLSLSLENDGEADAKVDLSSIIIDNQTLSFDGTSISISEGNAVDISSIDTDTDTDDQTLSFDGTSISISEGNAVDISSINTDTDTDDQTLSFDGTSISISEGNAVDISSIDTDTDDQTLSFDGTSVSISEGNAVNISSIDTDTDTDDQTLSFDGTSVSISEGNAVDISSIDTDTDDQTLSFDGTSISISEGNAVDISSIDTDTDTDDQTLSFDGTSISISEGNAVDISSIDTDTDTDDQTLSFDGTSISISEGNAVDISSINADNQQIDVLNLNGTVLEISLQDDGQATLSVDLTSLVPIGTIQMWPTSNPPTGWLLCNGNSFNATDFPELNSVLGSNTLPNFNGRFPLGAGTSGSSGAYNHPLQEQGGTEETQLTLSMIPEHTHDVTIEYRVGQENGSSNNYSDLTGSGASSTYTTSGTGGNGGNGNAEPHPNMPPFYVINYIIKAK